MRNQTTSGEQRRTTILATIMVLCLSITAEAKYSGGTGGLNDPYLIATAEDMNAIGADSNDWDAHFLLVADINLADYTGTQFNIIGYYINSSNNKPFTGVFDGNEHTISRFTYTTIDTNGIGLFSFVGGASAEVKNLTLIDPDVNAAGNSEYVGSLVGKMRSGTISGCSIEGGSVSGKWLIGGLVGHNDYESTITNCYSTASVTGNSAVGGLAGGNHWNGTITNCYSTGNIRGKAYLGRGANVGGLVGENLGTVTNCYSTGSVSGIERVGSLVGYNIYDGTITNCYSTGSVSGIEGVGGLVGDNEFGTITNCYSTGSVSGDDYVGGLVGFNWGTILDCYATGSVSGIEGVGGLVGDNEFGTITKCYSTGRVTGSSRVGGLVGYGYSTLVIASFWDIGTTGQSSSDGGTPKTTAEMKTRSTFTDAGWDFIEIWDIGENQTYPFLRVYPAGDINHDDIVNFYDFAMLADHWLEGG